MAVDRLCDLCGLSVGVVHTNSGKWLCSVCHTATFSKVSAEPSLTELSIKVERLIREVRTLKSSVKKIADYINSKMIMTRDPGDGEYIVV